MSGTPKKVGQAIWIKGMLDALLGLVYIAGAFTFERSRMLGSRTPRFQRDYLIWFALTGVFILFMGILDLLCVAPLKGGSPFAWKIAVWCAGFTAAMGLGGVIFFGISPPLLLLITGLSGLGMLGRARSAFQCPVPNESA